MLLILCIATIICYLVLSIGVMGGVPESLSSTYYGLKEDGWLFQLLCVGVGIVLLPMWLDQCRGSYEYLAFLACGGLIFTGAAPAFRMRLDGMVHYTAAVVCCVSSILWLLLSGNYPILIWWGVIGLMMFLQYGRWCWWFEVCVIGAVLSALLCG